MACHLASRHRIVQFRLTVGDGGPDRRELLAALRVLRGEIVAFLAKLQAACGGRFGGLPKLDELELEIVAAPLL
jgi:hypothetical protein